MNDYMMHLFPYLPKERIRTLSCGHVIPKENLVALPVSKGPSGREFEFTFEKRMLPAMVIIMTFRNFSNINTKNQYRSKTWVELSSIYVLLFHMVLCVSFLVMHIWNMLYPSGRKIVEVWVSLFGKDLQIGKLYSILDPNAE